MYFVPKYQITDKNKANRILEEEHDSKIEILKEENDEVAEVTFVTTEISFFKKKDNVSRNQAENIS